MDKRKYYVAGIIVVAIVAVLLQYQSCCSPSVNAAKQQVALIDQDNTDTLPQWQVTGVSTSSDIPGFLFNSGSDELQPVSDALQGEIKHLTDELGKTPFKSLAITGQYREGQPYELGIDRANAVSKVFADAGLDTTQIVTQAEKVEYIPTKEAQSVATSFAIIEDAGRLQAFESTQLAQKAEAAIVDANAKIAQLTDDKTKAEASLTAITAKQKATENKMSGLVTALNTTKAQLNQVADEKKAIEAQIHNLSAEQQRLAKTLKQVSDDKANLAEQLQQMTVEKNALMTRLDKVVADKTALEEKNSLGLVENNAAQTLQDDDAETAIARLEQKLSKAKTTNAALEKQLNQETTARKLAEENVQTVKQTLANKLSASQKTIASLTVELDKQKAELVKSTDRIAAIQTETADINALKQQLNETQTIKQSAEKALADIKRSSAEALASSDAKITSLNAALAKQQSELQQTKEKLTNALAVATTSQANTDKIDDLSKRLRDEETAHRATKEKLAQSIKARQSAEANKLKAIAEAVKVAQQGVASSIQKAPLHLYFKTNQTEISLTNEQKQKVELIKNYLSNVPDSQLLVIGHTDNIGERDMNIKLGLKRANFAADWLTQSGIARNRMLVQSKGPDAPMVNNTTSTNRALNRRVEVTIK